MLLYILDANLNTLGVVDTFISLIWITRSLKSSSCELYVPATIKYRRLLQGGRFLIRNDNDHVMYIQTVEEEHSSEGKKLIIRGKGAEFLFSKIMYPPKPSKEYITLFDVFEDSDILNKLQCDIDYSIFSTYHVQDLPTDYLNNNLEELTRYILSRINLMEDSESTWYKLIPQSYIIRYSEEAKIFPGARFQYSGHHLWVDVFNFDTIEYMPYLPPMMLSEDIGNIVDVTYTYSEEDCYSHIIAQINQGYTQQFTYIENGEEKTYNISFDDLDFAYKNGKIEDLPYYEYSLCSADPIKRNEKVITVDPVYEEYLYSPPATPGEYAYEYGYIWNSAAKMNKPYETGIYPSYGISNRVQVPKRVNEKQRHHYRINVERTINNMKKACQDEALLATENFQGTYQKLNRYQILDSPYANSVLGRIIMFRDIARQQDYYKRLDEIEEVWDEKGHRVIPVFGDRLKTIWDLI